MERKYPDSNYTKDLKHSNKKITQLKIGKRLEQIIHVKREIEMASPQKDIQHL